MAKSPKEFSLFRRQGHVAAQSRHLGRSLATRNPELLLQSLAEIPSPYAAEVILGQGNHGWGLYLSNTLIDSPFVGAVTLNTVSKVVRATSEESAVKSDVTGTVSVICRDVRRYMLMQDTALSSTTHFQASAVVRVTKALVRIEPIRESSARVTTVYDSSVNIQLR